MKPRSFNPIKLTEYLANPDYAETPTLELYLQVVNAYDRFSKSDDPTKQKYAEEKLKPLIDRLKTKKGA